jgi:hypothetical protein
MHGTQRTLFCLPDPLIAPSLLSGAVLLYFDGPFVCAAPPAVVTEESFELLRLVTARKPTWEHRIKKICGDLRAANIAACFLYDALQSQVPDTFRMVYFSFPADRGAYTRVDELIAAAGLEYRDLRASIIPTLGNAELARHIFLESYIEANKDIETLYSYCDSILSVEAIDSLEVASYFLRLQILDSVPPDTPVLLTNSEFLRILERVRKNRPSTLDVEAPEQFVNKDVVAWEFFRVLVSRLVDPLDSDRLRLVAKLRAKQREEVLRLRQRCQELSNKLAKETSVLGLGERAQSIIDNELRRELRDLFELDSRSWSDYLNALASDKVTWTSLAGIIAGIASSGPLVTTAGAVSAFATLGSTAVKVRAAREDWLRRNDFSLLRLLKHGT